MRDRAANSGIGPAAANVAAEFVKEIVGSGVGVLVEHRLAGHDEAGSAEAALRCVVVDKGLLDGMQLAVFHQGFDGRDLFSLALDGEHRASVDGLVVEQDRAGAALSFVADALGAGDVERIAQGVEQRNPWFQAGLVGLAVDVESHRDLARPMHGNLLARG